MPMRPITLCCIGLWYSTVRSAFMAELKSLCGGATPKDSVKNAQTVAQFNGVVGHKRGEHIARDENDGA